MSVKSMLLTASLAISMSSCMWGATTIPEIYLRQSDMTMELNREAYGIEATAVSRDGKYLLTGDNGGWDLMRGGYGTGKSSLRLWDLVQGRQIVKMDAGQTIISVALSPDIKYAVTGGFFPDAGPLRKTPFPPLQIWDIESGRLHKTIGSIPGFRGNEFNSINFSADGRYFLATDWTSIYVFNTSTWNLVKTLTPEGYSPRSIIPYKSFVANFSPDGKYILSGDPDAVLRLWDVETGREMKQLHGHKAGMLHGGICSIEFSPDGKYAVTAAYNDGNVILWDIEKGIEIKRLSGFPSAMGMYFMDKNLSFSPDGKHILAVGDTIRDVKTGAVTTDLTHAWKGIRIAGRNPVSGQYHPNGKYVLMTMDDAAVRIYDVKTGDEVAVLIGFADGEWLTITPEGYYNSSEKGAQYLNVQVGETSYSVESFYDVFYRPDIVTSKLKGDDIKDLITLTMQDAIKRPPPVVKINSVATTPASPRAKVCYNIESTGGGIGEVRLFHNGKLIESDGYFKEASKTAIEKTELAKLDSRAFYEDMRSIKIKEKSEFTPVTVRPKGDNLHDCKEIDAVSGENEVSIAAFNKDNSVQSYMQTAKFTSAIRPEDPHLYILSIGIDQYKDSTINLRYAVKDARDIQEKILQQAATLYKAQNIHCELLTDNHAGKANIIAKITELSGKIKPQDSFIFFAAGHGVLLQNQYYILTGEYDGRGTGTHLIGSNEIVDMSKKIKSLSQLLIFDTCHAGGVDYIVSGLYDARMSVLAKKMGLHIYASASGKQTALDGYRGNGLFTHALLDGLNNNRQADINKDGKITIVGLGKYSKDRTTKISTGIGHSQTPLIINFGKDSVLYKLQ
ncbi:MAG: Caspase domain protein [Smithella sp. PtaU1.Bin162]|nr:MAG: Caspase domain protein [Smithella sp. PtaU1.Bin162]